MSINYSIPVMLSLLAFFIADEDSLILKGLLRRGMQTQDRTSIRSRLAQLGKSNEEDYENFRIAQIALASICLLLLSIAYLTSAISLASYILLIAGSTLLVVLLTERNLKRKCERQAKEVESEFPSIIELLTLAVAAGESPAVAMKRISYRAHGLLAKEFSQVVTEVESGISLISALDGMSHRLKSDSIRRFVDSVVISISRGTSLVDTLTHSVREARSQERVRLLAAAGKSEISMMIPVVFLILPVSILFALFPSLTNLNSFTG